MAPHPEDVIYFDGGASPNPGLMMVAVVCGADRLLLRLDGIEGGNNEAEFRAAGVALDYAAANALRRPVIAGDSDAVIAALGGNRPPRTGRLTGLYEECAAKAGMIGGVVWRRVPRENPAGRLIQTERRAEKAARRSIRRRMHASIRNEAALGRALDRAALDAELREAAGLEERD